MKHEDEYWTISIRRTLQSFFRFLLRSSAFSHREIQELPLAVVQEIVYRIISISIPLFTLPTLFVAWSREQYLLFTILLSLSLVVLISAIRLLKSNVRIISPVTLLVLCAILYFAAVLLVQHQVMLWSYSFIASFYMMLDKRQAVKLNFLWILINSVIVFSLFDLEHAVIYTTSLFACGLAIELQSAILYRHELSLKEMALRDPLTNALNRRAMMRSLEQALATHNRYHTNMSIILMDLDHFKPINDNFGHNEGDLVLINFVETLTKRLRKTDRLFRHGGEEFAVLLPSTNLNEAKLIAESYCNLIRVATLSPKANVTISCGVATARTDETTSDWINRCDAALYRAKAKGRDQVEVTEP